MNLIAKTASPGPGVSVPTQESWKLLELSWNIWLCWFSNFLGGSFSYLFASGPRNWAILSAKSDSTSNFLHIATSKCQNTEIQTRTSRFFFTKMKIARNPEGFQVPGVVEMNPTVLPELFQHPSNLNHSQKCETKQFWTILELFNIKQIIFFMTTRRISMVPGPEPILLDLEKLFLLSDSLENQKFQSKTYNLMF